MPRDSSASAGNHDNSAPVSTITELIVRFSPGWAGFSISTSTRKVPMSALIMTPELTPSSSISLPSVSTARRSFAGSFPRTRSSCYQRSGPPRVATLVGLSHVGINPQLLERAFLLPSDSASCFRDRQLRPRLGASPDPRVGRSAATAWALESTVVKNTQRPSLLFSSDPPVLHLARRLPTL